MRGFEGDTLASALLANDRNARSAGASNTIARGVFCRPERKEPNGLFTLGEQGRTEPNVQGTITELFNGLDGAAPELLAICRAST